ncbi:MAG: holo-ACP synthase [Candidatus Kerfeldbacteria bacterium]
MEIKIGSDLASIQKFTTSARKGGKTFLDRLFTEEEQEQAQSMESLAGMFAAKEAAIKALGLSAGQWKMFEIEKVGDGKPKLTLVDSDVPIISHDVTITHDAEYAFATAVFIVE